MNLPFAAKSAGEVGKGPHISRCCHNAKQVDNNVSRSVLIRVLILSLAYRKRQNFEVWSANDKNVAPGRELTSARDFVILWPTPLNDSFVAVSHFVFV